MKDFSQLRDDFRRQRMAFIHVELDTGISFAQRAQAERDHGNEDSAVHNLSLARQAYKQAQHRICQCERDHAPEDFDSARNKSLDLLALIEAFNGRS